MKFSSLTVSFVLLVASGCGAAAEVNSGPVPTTIPLFEPVETTTDAGVATTAESTTTEVADSLAPSTSLETSTSSSTSEPAPTTTTSAPTTTTTTDPNAAYCASYNALVAMDTSIEPGDTEATAAVFAARETAWIETAALAPVSISTEAEIVRDFVSALRQLLAENGNDLGAVLFDAVELETELGADVAQIVVGQFGLLECGTEASSPEEETAVFYAGLLDTADRRSVLAELLATNGVLSVDQANCLVADATVDMMFPLAEAPSTADQEALLGQALGVCQLTGGGS